MSDWALVVGIVVIIGSVSAGAKGCNDSDNQLIQNAIAKGCSVYHYEHKGYQFDCPPKGKQLEVIQHE